MSPTEEDGDPVSGDLVEAPPQCEVPGDVAEAIRTLIRWTGDDPDREGLLDTPRGVARRRADSARRRGASRARGANMPAAMRRIPRSTSAGRSRKWADMTKSSF